MLNKQGERELAYFVKIDKVEPHPNADRLDIATVIGWHMVVGKGEFKEGDVAVYFEVDSLLPDASPFSEMEFLRSKHFKIKCQKIRGIISQGLLVPVAAFGWQVVYTDTNEIDYILDPITKKKYHVGDFLTTTLNVIYNDPIDNIRKGSSDKYKIMSQRNAKLAKTKIWRWLYKKSWGKKLLYCLFGHNNASKKAWPNWVVKTDEERVQNLFSWETNYANSKHWVATEKVDGSSATFTIRRTGNLIGPKYNYYVCSRNVVFDKPDKKCFYDTNIYQEMSDKYHIESVLIGLMDEHPEYKFVTLQGEVFGNKVQNRTYSIEDHDLRLFNFITSSDGRWDSIRAAKFWHNIFPWVPILEEDFTLPENRDDLIKFAHGMSRIDTKPREGIVFRSADGKQSFKVVDPEYLLEYHNG